MPLNAQDHPSHPTSTQTDFAPKRGLRSLFYFQRFKFQVALFSNRSFLQRNQSFAEVCGNSIVETEESHGRREEGRKEVMEGGRKDSLAFSGVY